jgi:hypothetical protein
MPNPFPGMDPYLEGDLWTTVHTDLCAEIARQLAPKLRPKYAALSTRRVVLAPPDENEGPAGQRFPDVAVLSSHAPGSSPGAAVPGGASLNQRGNGREEQRSRRRSRVHHPRNKASGTGLFSVPLALSFQSRRFAHFPSAACAAASRATGTRNGLQLT